MKYSISIPSVTLMLTTGLASGHMMLNNLAVWGFKSQGVNLEKPLNSGFAGLSWLHHGATKDTNEFVTLNPGAPTKLFVTCGEAVPNVNNAASLCQTVADIHMGGGCAISIAYPDASGNPTSGKDDFNIISVKADCPTLGNFQHEFPIPPNLPKCDNCVCAWHWVPDVRSSADESYMNTFNCKVTGGNGGKITNGKKPIYYGVNGGILSASPRPMYKGSAFPNGAQSLTIGGGGSTGTTVPPVADVPVPSPTLPPVAPEDDTPVGDAPTQTTPPTVDTPVDDDTEEEDGDNEDPEPTGPPPSAEHGGWGNGRGGRCGGRCGGRRGGRKGNTRY